MTARELIFEFVKELPVGSAVWIEASRFNRTGYVLRREGRSSSFPTEYCTIAIKTGKLVIIGKNSVTITIDIADPNCFKQVCEILKDDKIWIGSHKSIAIPIAKNYYPDEELGL